MKLAGDRKAVTGQVLEFVRGRLKALWSEEFDADLVEAVLAAGFDDVVDARQRLQALAVVKPARRLRAAGGGVQARRQHPGEGPGRAAPRWTPRCWPSRPSGACGSSWSGWSARRRRCATRRDYPAILRAVATLKPAVDAFFDDVMVMAEDPPVRANRLALMRRVAALFADVADFRKIQAELPPGAGQRKA